MEVIMRSLNMLLAVLALGVVSAGAAVVVGSPGMASMDPFCAS